jgi:WD40 repeat protein
MQPPHDRVRELFLEASEIDSAGERDAFLTGACGANTALRAQVEEMLGAVTEAGDFFQPFEGKEAPPPRTAEISPERVPIREGPGSLIGRYKLLEQIGEGGFGAVYMAEQVEPVRRKVALKIIKLGMDTREVIARFDAERQALALMDHPNVARVLDAGATASGRPFFVMELVRGLPITEYCDRHCLDTTRRIELFIQVCHAAQHAHSKGIIHRDLKPSNILIASQDGVPIPKVIDFGIAKAMQTPLTDKTLFTRFGQMVGTPVYMSPEHLDGVDVDTRSDIYSLGVILYELLTGKQPFDLRELREAGHSEMLRVIREEDPPVPSTRLTTLGRELPEIAQHRNIHPKRLGELVRGDLDWITMKALRKNRAHRYATPMALAEDLQRHLHHQPVTAGPVGAGYRAWKFILRHRYGVAAGCGVFLALLVGLVVATYAFLKARSERERAVFAERVSEQQGLIAMLEAQRSKANEARARRVSYASDMGLASHALEVSNLGRVLSLLRRQTPSPGGGDLRGWEWRYLWQQCQSAELFQLGAFSNSVMSLAVPANGALVVASDTDGAAALWDLPARAIMRSIKVNPILALSPDGRMLADGGGVIREVESGRVVRRLAADGPIKKLAFSADGRLLAGFAGMRQLCVWDCGNWELLWSQPGFPAASLHFGGVAFARSGGWMAVGTADGKLHLLEARTGRGLRSWQAQRDGVTSVSLSADGALLASASGYSDDKIRLWNTSDGSLNGVLEGHHAWVTSVAFSPEGRLLASAGADQNVCLWDTGGRERVALLRGHLHEIWAMAFLPDAKGLVTGGKDGALKVWRIPAAAKELPGRDFEPRDWMVLEAMPREFAFAPNGGELFGIRKGGQVGRWSLPSLQWAGTIDALGANNYLVASAGLGLLAVVNDEANLRIWDSESGTILASRPLCPPTNHVTWLGFTRDGRSLVSIVDHCQVDTWQVEPFQRVSGWRIKERALAPASLSPDGRHLAAGGRDLAIYDMKDGALLSRKSPHKLSVYALAFSPKGDLLATCSQDGQAKIWRADNWQEVGSLKGHLLGVHSVAFSPDGSRLATGSLGKEFVKLWDLSTMQEVLNLTARGGRAVCMSFSPEGRSLVTLDSEASLGCWSAPLFHEIRQTDTLNPQ